MPLYEHVLIARQDLSNAQAEGLIEHFSTVLSDNGGKVVGTEYWGVKTMAYKINKNRKGHYAFLRTDAPPAAVQEMERLARLNHCAPSDEAVVALKAAHERCLAELADWRKAAA